MSVYSQLQKANQTAFLQTSRATGITIEFQHKACGVTAEFVSLYAKIDEETVSSVDQDGNVDTETTTSFEISTLQLGFNILDGKDPVALGDLVRLDGQTYSVEKYTGNRYRGTFILSVNLSKRLRTGIK